jgi:hypothetical protein
MTTTAIIWALVLLLFGASGETPTGKNINR